MASETNDDAISTRLRLGVVVRVEEDICQIFGDELHRSVRYATSFPSPHTERVSPGHLLAVAAAADGSEVAIWRWYDAVILGEQGDLVRLWEPSHGEVVAQPRRTCQEWQPGTRAYLSGGLPGADWWVTSAVATKAADAEVELDEVERFYDDHQLWSGLA